MASPNLDEITTTTLRNRSGDLADSVLHNTALLLRLKDKGRVRPFAGGRTIVQEIAYQENSASGWFSGLDTLSVQGSDVITAAEYNIKQAYAAVVISGLEELQNSGKEQVIDLLESRIEVAESTMTNLISTGIYSDGTGAGGKQIDGLQAQVPDDPTTGTVGGINRATWTFWRSVKFGAVADGGGAATSSNIQSYMNRLYVQLVRGRNAPDLFPADNTYYRLYLDSLQSIQRISNDRMAQAGFQSLQYMGGDVVLDGGVGGDCPASHMFFLNTDYIFFRPHSKRNMVPLNPDRYATNQDAVVKLIGWAGNMTMSAGKFNGVLIA